MTAETKVGRSGSFEEARDQGKRVFEYIRGDRADFGDDHTIFSEAGAVICQFGGFVPKVTAGHCGISAIVYVQTLMYHGTDASANCGLTIPPKTSGEMASDGVEMRMFPRNISMPMDYSGCQTIWGLDRQAGRMVLMATRQYLRGSVVQMTDYSPELGASPQICAYRDQKLTTGSGHCPSFEVANQREQSLPPGCLKKLEHSVLENHEPCFQDLK